MENIDLSVQGNLLTIVIDMDQEIGESASGKSVIIATTGGNISVPGREEIKLGLNLYRPVQAGRSVRRYR